jgi:hypothetical protein
VSKKKESLQDGDKLVSSNEGFALHRKGYIIQPYFYTFSFAKPDNENDVLGLAKSLAAKYKLKIGEVKGKYPFLILELKRR